MESRSVQAVCFALVCMLFVLPILGRLLRQLGVSWLRAVQRQRQRHPGHPEDCPLCREAKLAVRPDGVSVRQTVEPWTACKSRRGRKKSLDTEGVAYP
jgi:hypothetical protein